MVTFISLFSFRYFKREIDHVPVAHRAVKSCQLHFLSVSNQKPINSLVKVADDLLDSRLGMEESTNLFFEVKNIKNKYAAVFSSDVLSRALITNQYIDKKSAIELARDNYQFSSELINRGDLVNIRLAMDAAEVQYEEVMTAIQSKIKYRIREAFSQRKVSQAFKEKAISALYDYNESIWTLHLRHSEMKSLDNWMKAKSEGGDALTDFKIELETQFNNRIDSLKEKMKNVFKRTANNTNVMSDRFDSESFQYGANLKDVLIDLFIASEVDIKKIPSMIENANSLFKPMLEANFSRPYENYHLLTDYEAFVKRYKVLLELLTNKMKEARLEVDLGTIQNFIKTLDIHDFKISIEDIEISARKELARVDRGRPTEVERRMLERAMKFIGHHTELMNKEALKTYNQYQIYKRLL